MKIVMIELSRHEFRQKIINGGNKRRNDQLARVERAQAGTVHTYPSETLWIDQGKAKSELRKHYSKARLG